MKKLVKLVWKDDRGTAVTEWVVAASIMAMAGIATFAAIGTDVSLILTTIANEVSTLQASVN